MAPPAPSRARVFALTAIALACFAGNSLLCRAALAAGRIDAASFTVVRLVSGAVVLLVLAHGRPADPGMTERGRFLNAAALFGYAAPFSFAYLRLGAAVGALVLFASVQVTMIGWAIAHGERPKALAWLGILLAVAGLVGLTAAGRSAPDPIGTGAMAIAGIAWGVYSLRGRGAKGDPVVATAASFVRASALALPLLLLRPRAPALSGLALAAASGALASGVGYSIWYAALRHLSASRAAVLQLLVPILAAAAAFAFLGEPLTTRLALASAAIVGGVSITLRARAR